MSWNKDAKRQQPLIGTFKSRTDAVNLLESDPADVVLMADGVTHNRQQLYELVRGVHAACPQAAIVLLKDSFCRELVVNALRAGARGLFCLAIATLQTPVSVCR